MDKELLQRELRQLKEMIKKKYPDDYGMRMYSFINAIVGDLIAGKSAEEIFTTFQHWNDEPRK